MLDYYQKRKTLLESCLGIISKNILRYEVLIQDQFNVEISDNHFALGILPTEDIELGSYSSVFNWKPFMGASIHWKKYGLAVALYGIKVKELNFFWDFEDKAFIAEYIHVEDKFQGNGIGSQGINFMERLAMELGAKEFVADLILPNRIKFWRDRPNYVFVREDVAVRKL